jgi:hypothetical protein
MSVDHKRKKVVRKYIKKKDKSIVQAKIKRIIKRKTTKREPRILKKKVVFGKTITMQFNQEVKEKRKWKRFNRRDNEHSERESLRSTSGHSDGSRKPVSILSSSHPNFEMSLRPKDEDDLAETLLHNQHKFTRTFVRNIHKAWLKKYQPHSSKREWLIDHINKTLKSNMSKYFPRQEHKEKDAHAPSHISEEAMAKPAQEHKRVYRSKNSIRKQQAVLKAAPLAKIPPVVYKNPAIFIGDSGCFGFNLVESDIENNQKPVKRPYNRQKPTKKALSQQIPSDSDDSECSSEREFKAKIIQMSKKESMRKVSTVQFKREFQEYMRKVRGDEDYDFPNLGKLTLVDPETEEPPESLPTAPVKVQKMKIEDRVRGRRAKDSVTLSLSRQRQALDKLVSTKRSQREERAKLRGEKSDAEGPAVKFIKNLVSVLPKKRGRKPGLKKETSVPKKRGRPPKLPLESAPIANELVQKKRGPKPDGGKPHKKDRLEKIRESVSKRLYAEDQVEESKLPPKKSEAELLGKRKSVSPLPDNRLTSARKVLVDATKTTMASTKKPSASKHLLHSPAYISTLKKEVTDGQKLFLEDLRDELKVQTRKKSLDDRQAPEESAYKLEQITVKKGEETTTHIKESLNKIFDRIGNDCKRSVDKGKISLKEKDGLFADGKMNGVLTERSQNLIDNIIKRSIIKSTKKSEVKEAAVDQEKVNSILKLPEASVRYEEFLKPQGQLQLPHQYKRLLQKFEKLDDVINFMNMKQAPTYLKVVSKAYSTSLNE